MLSGDLSLLCAFVQAPGTGGWGVSSRQHPLPTSTSHSPAAPTAPRRVKVAGHRTVGGTRVAFVLQTDAPGGCAYFRGLFLIFLPVEEKVVSRDTQSLPQATPPELLFSAAISSHF